MPKDDSASNQDTGASDDPTLDDADLLGRCRARLARLAHARLSPKLRARLSTSDLVQSVFREFLENLQKGRPAPDSFQEIWKLLAGIMKNKARELERTHRGTEKRSVNKEVSLHQDSVDLPVLAREPTPNEVAVFHEQLEQLEHQLGFASARIVECRLQGMTYIEISRQTGQSVHIVKRKLSEVRAWILRSADSRRSPDEPGDGPCRPGPQENS